MEQQARKICGKLELDDLAYERELIAAKIGQSVASKMKESGLEVCFFSLCEITCDVPGGAGRAGNLDGHVTVPADSGDEPTVFEANMEVGS